MVPLRQPTDRHGEEQTAALSRHRVRVIVRVCCVLGDIYEHTKKLDTQPATQATRRSRDIPSFVKNMFDHMYDIEL